MLTLSYLCLKKQKNGAIDPKSVKANARQAQTGLCLMFVAVFALLATKMVLTAEKTPEPSMLATEPAAPPQFGKTRPDIADRNGRLLATDIRFYWLYANPAQLRSTIGADEAAEKLASLFKDMNAPALAAKFRDTKSTFEWIKRGLTPNQAEAVHNLGIPGLYLVTAPQRVYPAGNEASHILGVTSVDNVGLAGIEKYIDGKYGDYTDTGTLATRPTIKLSVDLGIQHAITDELSAAKDKYQAQAAMGLLMDVNTGEVLAAVSLPDFDGNRRESAFEDYHQNRIVSDNYELGSIFKTFTIAMTLEEGIARRTDMIDVATPIVEGGFTVSEHHSSQPKLSVDDIFIHSSNTGAARLAMMAGIEHQRAFLQKLGLFNQLETEVGTTPKPRLPSPWRTVNLMTIAYGHGIAVPPLSFAAAEATLVNGGVRIKPTFFIADGADSAKGEQLITPETSAAIRDMMRLTVQRGTGKRADIPGLAIGGKTGTAKKVKEGQYTSDVINSFVAAFPIDHPKYLLLITLDEPKAEKPAENEAAYNAVPTAATIIRRIAPMLNILPTDRFDEAAAKSYEQSKQTVQTGTKHNEPGRSRPKYPAFGQSAVLPGTRNPRANGG